jgi:hypothetical protein
MHRAISEFIDWVRPPGEMAKAARHCEQRFTVTRSHCDQVGTAKSHLSRNFRGLHRPPRFLTMGARIANTKAITSSGRNNRFDFAALHGRFNSLKFARFVLSSSTLSKDYFCRLILNI